MPPLLPWIVANGATLIVLAALFAYLYTSTRRAPLRFWYLAFLTAACGQMLAGVEELLGRPMMLLLPSLIGVSLTVVAYYYGVMAAVERRPTPVVWVLAGIGVAATPILWLMGATVELTALPAIAFVTLGLGFCGATLIAHRPRSGSGWIAGTAMVLLAVHILVYPVFAANVAYMPWGFTIAILLNILIAVGLVMNDFEAAYDELLLREQELALARRRAAVAQLAGGIAHDFNNLLMVISSNAQIATADTTSDEVLFSLEGIRTAADQATRLTAQLLALGQRRLLHSSSVDLHAMFSQAVQMIAKVMPDNIEVELHNLPEQTWMMVDRAGLEQITLNLIFNARDAMPDGGRLVVWVALLEEHTVELRVQDSGTGMDQATVDRIFEPFFTTRPAGTGTGLGLATVKGIVDQLRGTVTVYTEPGEGTQMIVTLPAHKPGTPAPASPRGTDD